MYAIRSYYADSLKYVDASTLPLIGKGFEDTQNRYERLPATLQDVTRPPVWNLSKNCSGLAIRFRTNSTAIGAKWEVTGDVVMNHFTMTGIKGLDLYCLENGKWQFVVITSYSIHYTKLYETKTEHPEEKKAFSPRSYAR